MNLNELNETLAEKDVHLVHQNNVPLFQTLIQCLPSSTLEYDPIRTELRGILRSIISQPSVTDESRDKLSITLLSLGLSTGTFSKA
jgi:hypothetical protein